MYGNPGFIRKHRLVLNLNDQEAMMVDALVEIEGGERAAVMREILIGHIQATLAKKASHSANFDAAEAPIQHAN